MNYHFINEVLPAYAVQFNDATQYNYWLVALCFALAMLGCLLAVQIFKAGHYSINKFRQLSIILGGLVLGTTIWTVHFIGMLSYAIPLVHDYLPLQTGLAGIAAILLAAFVIFLQLKPDFGLMHLVLSSIFYTAALFIMHYLGMEAMRVDAEKWYWPHMLSTSLAVTLLLSLICMGLLHYMFRFSNYRRWLQYVVAGMMALSIFATHYLGMFSTVLVPMENCRFDHNQSHSLLVEAITLACITSAFITFALLGKILAIKAISRETIFSGRGIIMLKGFIIISVTAVIIYINIQAQRDIDKLAQRYRNDVKTVSVVTKQNIEYGFQRLQQTLQTMTQLLSVRGINQDAQHLSTNDFITISTLYHNLALDFRIHEMYIIPDGLEDYASHLENKQQLPIIEIESDDFYKKTPESLHFNIQAAHWGKQQHEVMREHWLWLKLHFPKLPEYSNYPNMISSEISICDTEDEVGDYLGETGEDCNGFVYTMPYYNFKGDFQGVISTTFSKTELQNMMTNVHYAISNSYYETVITPPYPNHAVQTSMDFISRGMVNPNIFYSESIPLKINDVHKGWNFWIGVPDQEFLESKQYQTINEYRYTACGVIFIFGFFSLIMLRFIRMSYVSEREQWQKAHQAADDANNLKSDFLANISHELRTPLNSIIGMSGLLAEQTNDEETKNMVETIELSSRNLLHIVNDILDISKIESGHLTLECIPFSPLKCAEDVVNMLKPMASKKGLLLQLRAQELTQGYALGDPLRYTRIVTNLVGNAIKYTDQGEVNVHYLSEYIDKNIALIQLKVTDTGIGIDKNKLENIFQKFTQADSSTTRKYGGSGLGLAITKQLVEMMDGEIVVNSAYGVGSTFITSIPFVLTTEQRPPSHNEQHIHVGNLPSKEARVLVAEDHLLNQHFLKQFLSAVGLKNYTIVNHGKEAVDAYLQDNYDLILMDCHMPEMNGYEATKQIREHELYTHQHIPIIAMTANAMMSEKEKCLSVGMDAHLSKPVDKHEFMQVLSQWIQFSPVASKSSPELPPVSTNLDLRILKTYSNNDKDIEHEFAQIFVKETIKHLTKLEEYCDSGPNTEWVEIAHALKGSAAGFGAYVMKEACARAQQMADASADDRSVMLSEIREKFQDVTMELKQMGLI